MTSSTIITVSNGREFYRIPAGDLDEAQQDGFYVPAEQDRTIVSDGAELFEVPLADVEEAEQDGFRDLLAEERAAAEAIDEETAPHLNRRQLLGVYGFSSLVHAVALLVLFVIIIPIPIDDRFEILSALPNVDQESVQVEEIALVQPDQLQPDAPSEVVQDLITDNDKVIEIDINDLDISSVIPEKTKGAGNPVAKVTGELGGRSQAGRSALVARYGGNAASEGAVRAGLEWLSKHQNENGSWSFDHVHAACQGSCSQAGSLKKSHMGATAMALLAMLGSGHTHFAGNFRPQVYKGFDYLLSYGKRSSSTLDLRGAAEGNTGMYIQGLATIALCEAVIMSEAASKRRSRSRTKTSKSARVDRKALQTSLGRLRVASQLALNFIVQAQHPDNGGWRYQPRKDGDTSVLGWQVMALKSGEMAKMKILPASLRGASYYLDSVQTDNGACYGYTGPGRRPSTTAVGLLSRMYLGWDRKRPALKAGIEFLSKAGPNRNDMYYNYYATQVMHHWGGEPWDKWNKVMRKQLVDSQRKDDHAAGSWNVADTHGRSGGRLYMTCLCVMTLEVYYRHLPLYQQAGAIKSARSKKSR